MHDQLDRLWQQLKAFAQAGTAVHQFERRLSRELLKMGFELLGYFFRHLGPGDQGAQVALPDGRGVKRLHGLHERRYQSGFGEYLLPRLGVRGAGKAGSSVRAAGCTAAVTGEFVFLPVAGLGTSAGGGIFVRARRRSAALNPGIEAWRVGAGANEPGDGRRDDGVHEGGQGATFGRG